MSRAVKVQGVKCPFVREGDKLTDIVVDSVIESQREWWHKDDFHTMPEYSVVHIHDKDIIGITESVVARAAGQYVTVDEIAEDIEKKFGKDATICLVNPIYSRNRFSLILKGIARAAKKVIIVMPKYDEVGNPRGVNPFTGVNIEEYYKELCRSENCEYVVTDIEQIPTSLNNIYCGLHDYVEWKKNFDTPLMHLKWGDDVSFLTLADICSDKSPDWGLLGTNKATEEKLKLFPSKAECQGVCEEVKAKIKEKIGKDVIVCIYGDGCFKDPVGGIWEFADPITMPGYTDKELIESTPRELKLKSMIDECVSTDSESDDLALKGAIQRNREIKMSESLHKKCSGAGTTPRVYRDLLASLMDLTSGSGDRATPVVLVQNYF